MSVIADVASNSDQVVSQESLKYAVAMIDAAKDSAYGMIALVCLVVGFAFYALSAAKSGFNLHSTVAYAFTLAFFGVVVFAIYHTSGVVKTIYYAGQSGPNFNVGRLTRTSDTTWEDMAILVAGDPDNGKGFIYHFIAPVIQGNALTLQADPKERVGSLKIDFDSKTIWWLFPGDPPKELYRIIVAM